MLSNFIILFYKYNYFLRVKVIFTFQVKSTSEDYFYFIFFS